MQSNLRKIGLSDSLSFFLHRSAEPAVQAAASPVRERAKKPQPEPATVCSPHRVVFHAQESLSHELAKLKAELTENHRREMEDVKSQVKLLDDEVKALRYDTVHVLILNVAEESDGKV